MYCDVVFMWHCMPYVCIPIYLCNVDVMISTLLAQAADQEPNPRSTMKKKNSKISKHRSHVMIITLPVPATVVVVICEPRGLINPITMGIKTS